MSDHIPADPAAWRAAIERLSPMTPPCRRLTPARWGELREACLDFLDRFGPEAQRLGWTAADLFGVHPEQGTLRVDWCGALMIGPGRASAVEADRIVFERTAAYRGRPGQPSGIPIWEHAARRAQAGQGSAL